MGSIKIVGIAGSPRRGNTELLVKEALKAAESIGDVETEFISLAGKKIQPCKADYRCTIEGTFDLPCPTIPDDDANEILKKLVLADGIIVGSPVYWGGVTAQLKALFDRSMSVESQNKSLRNKVAGAISVAFDRHGGQETTVLSIHWWMLINDMIVVGPGPEVPKLVWGGTWVEWRPRASHTLSRVQQRKRFLLLWKMRSVLIPLEGLGKELLKWQR